MTPLAEAPPNPAKWNDGVLDVIRPVLRREARRVQHDLHVLDNHAGVGKIHLLADPPDTRAKYRIVTTGVEIEPEWASQHLDTEVGNAMNLRFEDGAFDAVVTSCVFGNRMSDHHDAQERCKFCDGTGMVNVRGENVPLVEMVCEKCLGEGRRDYKRHTYRHYLGRELHEDNVGQLQWGPSWKAIERYQDAYKVIWAEAARVIAPRGLLILNISNHVRTLAGKRQEMPVRQWHESCITDLGFKLSKLTSVETQRLRHGENHDSRVTHEYVYVFRKKS